MSNCPELDYNPMQRVIIDYFQLYVHRKTMYSIICLNANINIHKLNIYNYIYIYIDRISIIPNISFVPSDLLSCPYCRSAFSMKSWHEHLVRTSDQEVGSGISPSRNLSTGMVIHRNGDDLGMVYGIGFTTYSSYW